jgi:hypothetical protein
MFVSVACRMKPKMLSKQLATNNSALEVAC